MIIESATNSLYALDEQPSEIKLLHPAAALRADHKHPALAIVVAAARDGAIGINGDMIWHIREDLRHFKALTTGGTVIMGRKTWESLPKRPLPGRRNIVVSRTDGYNAPGAETVTDIADAIGLAAGDTAAFIIGGGEIYRRTLPFVSAVYLTRIEATAPEADTFFPRLEPEEWVLTEASATFPASDTHPPYRFETWRRK